MLRHRKKISGLALSLALVAAACGGDDADDASGAPPATTAAGGAATTAAVDGAASTTMMEMMELPASAAAMKIDFVSPADGTKVTANEVDIEVAVEGFELTNTAGKPLVDGQGHYHLLLDGALVDMFITPKATLSMQNVSPGKHEIAVVPAINDHAEVLDNEAKITIDYQPSAPLPEIKDAELSDPPTIKIVSPKPGDTVSGEFDVVVEVENFNLDPNLFGKPSLLGYGHWHANLDTAEGPMMGMMTMLGMSGTTTFKASTEGMAPGEKHKLIAIVADNGHAPLNPMVTDEIDITVG